MKTIAAALLLAAGVAALATGPARAAQQQTFWELSSGPAPAPLPTPTSWPVDWYGSLYYPVNWPVCGGGNGGGHHCRPPHGHVWPPKTPKGQHAVPKPPR